MVTLARPLARQAMGPTPQAIAGYGRSDREEQHNITNIKCPPRTGSTDCPNLHCRSTRARGRACETCPGCVARVMQLFTPACVVLRAVSPMCVRLCVCVFCSVQHSAYAMCVCVYVCVRVCVCVCSCLCICTCVRVRERRLHKL